jgi:hypothetical protein
MLWYRGYYRKQYSNYIDRYWLHVIKTRLHTDVILLWGNGHDFGLISDIELDYTTPPYIIADYIEEQEGENLISKCLRSTTLT